MQDPDDTAGADIFPQCNINSLLVWGDGGHAGALKGGSHPHTTAHSCPPGPATALGQFTGCVHIHAPLLLLPPFLHHLFPCLSGSTPHLLTRDPVTEVSALITDGHKVASHSLTLQPLTTVERHDADIHSRTLSWILTNVPTKSLLSSRKVTTAKCYIGVTCPVTCAACRQPQECNN